MWREIIELWKSDNLLQQAYDQSFEMLELANEMFKDALKCIRKRDRKIDEETRKKDKIVNAFERDVRRKVLTHISVRGATNELPAGLVLVTIIIDIERIGDYIKNILDLGALHTPNIEGTEYEKTVQETENAVDALFSNTMISIKNNDDALALKMMRESRDIMKKCDQIIDHFIKDNLDDLGTNDVAYMALYFRYLKRISAHLRNMTSSVVNPFDRIGYKFKKKK